MFKKIVTFYFLFFIAISGAAQDSINSNASVQLKVRAQKDKILLRWAADTPIAWQRVNNYGYIIERFTIKREGVLLENPEKVILTSIPLKPLPLPVWEDAVTSNDNAAIVAPLPHDCIVW